MAARGLVAIAFGSVTFAQQFDAIVVRPHQEQRSADFSAPRGVMPGGKRFEVSGTTLPLLISLAYGISPRLCCTGGPAWVYSSVWDVLAVSDESVSRPTMMVMVQHLLEAEFKLKLEDRKTTVKCRVLTVAPSGTTLVPDARDKQFVDWVPHIGYREPGHYHAIFMGYTLDELADFLSYYPGYPIVNRTELRGRYDIPIYFAIPGADAINTRDPNFNPGPSLGEAIHAMGLETKPSTTEETRYFVIRAEKPVNP